MKYIEVMIDPRQDALRMAQMQNDNGIRVIINPRQNDLRQNYDKIMLKVKNDNYVLSSELLNDVQFFFHILKRGDAQILITFFDAASKNGVSIKKIIESQNGREALEHTAYSIRVCSAKS